MGPIYYSFRKKVNFTLSQVCAGCARIFVMYFQSNFENTFYVRPENLKVFANQVKSVSGYSGTQTLSRS